MQIKHENGTKEHELKKMQNALDIERRSQNANNRTEEVQKPKSGSKLSMLQAILVAFVFLMVGAYFGRSKTVAVEELKAETNPFSADFVGGCTKPKAGEKKACDGKKKVDL